MTLVSLLILTLFAALALNVFLCGLLGATLYRQMELMAKVRECYALMAIVTRETERRVVVFEESAG